MSSGKPIAHHTLVLQLMDAILLPKQVAVYKCEAHTSNTDAVSQGNARADAAAKDAACQELTTSEFFLHDNSDTPSTPTADLQELQQRADHAERTLWRKSGCVFSAGVWWYAPMENHVCQNICFLTMQS